MKGVIASIHEAKRGAGQALDADHATLIRILPSAVPIIHEGSMRVW